MDSYENLHAQYKSMLNQAYQLSKSDKSESKRLYAKADELRQQLFAL